MRLIKPSFEIEHIPEYPLKIIESFGRVCYKSEDAITQDSSKNFVNRLLKSGHHSVIEHTYMSIRFIADRGFTHELVRHRLVAYSQESTRYCNYKGGVTFIIPPWIKIDPGDIDREAILLMANDKSEDIMTWLKVMAYAEDSYISLIKNGWSPQEARSVLPNSLKTEIIATANFREWRHIFKLRTSSKAHPQMRELMLPLLAEVRHEVPIIFDEL